MTINKIDENLKRLKIKTRILGIDSLEKANRFGTTSTIVVLKTADGNFSNFKTVLDDQMLDISSLTPQDEVEITYVIHVARHNFKFMNFIKIERL